MDKQNSESQQFLSRTGKYSDRISRRGYLPEALPERCPMCDHKLWNCHMRDVQEHMELRDDMTEAEKTNYWMRRAIHFEREYRSERKMRQKRTKMVQALCQSTLIPHS